VLKIQKGNQAAYNAKLRGKRVKKNRTQASNFVRIGEGSKPNHAERAVPLDMLTKAMLVRQHVAKTLHEVDPWEDYEIDVMAIEHNRNFLALHSHYDSPSLTGDGHPLFRELTEQVAVEEEVPVKMVVDVLWQKLGRVARPQDMTLEEVVAIPEQRSSHEYREWISNEDHKVATPTEAYDDFEAREAQAAYDDEWVGRQA
jgi:hypothetical protein